jgi:rubrerythrin
MLPIDIQTPGQLLSAAIAVESESIKHYADMAARMQYYGKKETVELFERLARESLQRKDQIVEWAELEGIELTELAEKVVWEDPLMPTTYDAEARDPYRSTPYKTLAYAAHNADRAFHLYIHIAAMTEDQQTETYAKTLANDALNRSRLLQSRRRRAYHTEHRGLWQQQLDLKKDQYGI